MTTTAATAEELLGLAIRHVNAGRADRALLLCEHAKATHPPHPGVLQLLALLNLQRGRPAVACEQAQASLALRPDHPQTASLCADAWFQLALVRQDGHDLDGAADALRQVLRLSPGRAEAHVNLGIVLQDGGRADEAMREYGRAFCLREDTFGRIAHALCAPNVGRLWLRLDDLRAALRAA